MKGQLKRLLSVKTRNSLAASDSPNPTALPEDIFREIANHLTKPDILTLSSASSELRKFLLPEIWSKVSKKCGSDECASVLRMLLKSPQLCVYIRDFSVGPDWLSWPIEPTTEFWVASMIVKITPQMQNLHTFTWCGLQPPPDYLWSTLRKSCPELRKVNCTARIREFDPQSELFQFANLTHFALCVKEHDGELRTPRSDLPPQLFEMLLQRCPDLEELRLQLFSSHHNLRQLSRITQGLWPRISSFHLEVSEYDPPTNSQYPRADELGAFLSAHPTITDLGLYRVFGIESPLILTPTALPHVSSFTGLFHDVYNLPFPTALQSLDLLNLGIFQSSLLVPMLQRLTSLTSLGMTVDGIGLLHDVMSVCPALEIFTVQYGASCSMKQIKEICGALRRLPRLHTLTLSTQYRVTDATMLACALELLAHNLRLCEIHLISVSDKGWKQSGDYKIVGQSRFLDAKEFGRRTLGGTFSRRFRYALDGGGSVSKGLAKMRR
ncbi:hypothetical protein FB451DRAFT_1142385 [Mycena latifolia]|nr:hypothetical protein FB451DRAFT_1142385 [Mycena latifolia]